MIIKNYAVPLRPFQHLMIVYKSRKVKKSIFACFIFLGLLGGCSQEKILDIRNSSDFKNKITTKSLPAPQITQKTEQKLQTELTSLVSDQKVSLNPLTLDDALKIGLTRSPDVALRDALIRRSQAGIALAKSALYPSLEYTVSPEYSKTRNGTGSLGVSLPLFDFGFNKYQIAAAHTKFDGAKNDRNSTANDVGTQIAIHYINYAAHQDKIKVTKAYLIAIGKILSKIESRVEAGAANETDVTEARLSLMRAQGEMASAQSSLSATQADLAQTIGVVPQKVWDLTTLRTHIQDKEEGDIPNSPTIKALESQLALAKKNVDMERAKLFPSLKLGVSQGYESVKSSGFDSGKVFVGLNLGGSYSFGQAGRYNLRVAQEDVAAAQRKIDAQLLTANSQKQVAIVRNDSALFRAKISENIDGIATATRDLFWQQYEIGTRTLTNVLTAERDIYNAQIDKIEAKADSLKSIVTVKSINGNFALNAPSLELSGVKSGQ
jgi:outer membrane protein, adhesin transport system